MQRAGLAPVSQMLPPTPSLSVVIPTRNRANTLTRAIQSALSSDRSDVEVVVIDDSSTDGTNRRDHGADDPRLLWKRLESSGNANRARNVGAALARAPVIALLDSDDAFAPGRVDRLIRFFATRPDVDCLIDGYVEIARGQALTHRTPDFTPSVAEIRRMLLGHLLPLTNSAITLRRSSFEAIGGYNEAMPRHQDRELLLRLAMGHRLWFGQETDVVKHRADNSLSHETDGYVAGLDALAANCPDYARPEYADLFHYLTVRGILKSFATGHWAAGLRELRRLRSAKHLPQNFLYSVSRYRAGRRWRARAAKSLALATQNPITSEVAP